jgi:hypothetical protein
MTLNPNPPIYSPNKPNPRPAPSQGGGGEQPPKPPGGQVYNPSENGRRRRGRPRIKQEELASVRVEARVHPTDLSGFKERCAANNMSAAEAIREFIRKGTFTVTAPPPSIDWSGVGVHLLRNLQAYGVNLNQITKALNSSVLKGSVSQTVLAHLRQAVDLAKQAVDRLLPAVEQAVKNPPAPAPVANNTIQKPHPWWRPPFFGRGA